MEQVPCLVSCKPLKSEFTDVENIYITSDIFTLGRATNNAVIIPFPSISRNHCIFRKINCGEWIIEDYSTFGIHINGNKVGKGSKRKLSHEDILTLEPCDEFVYKFVVNSENNIAIPNKRRKIERIPSDSNIISNMKIKFAESQNFELKYIEDKIQSTQQMQNTSKVLKDQLQQDMNRKIQQLESSYEQQIENLKGEKGEVERQKLLLIQERDAQLTAIKCEMEQRITELREQIKKHNETESELLLENNLLKDRLLKEKEEFLNELNRETSSKQEILEKLEAKIRDQEETRLKEKKELEEILRKETEQLRMAKEKEFKKLEEEKNQCERDLKRELDHIKENLLKQVKQTDEQKRKSEEELNKKMEEIKKLNDLEKAKMEQLIQERDSIQMKLSEAQESAAKSLEDLKARVTERETELAVLAAERIQQQAEQSGEVIQNLQEQLEKVRNQLQNVESEKSILIQQNLSTLDPVGEGSSKQSTLNEFGELMESELQCSICSELFVEATTLNCSHTFCKYCITKWKKKKKECPMCRAYIATECRSLVLDSFIDKMVQNLTEEIKNKRMEMLRSRQELTSEHIQERNKETDRRDTSDEYSDTSTSEESEEENNSEESLEVSEYERSPSYSFLNTDSRTEYDTDNEFGIDTFDLDYSGDLRHRRIPGLPGAYYGGYGSCFKCGASGHWAPGCPFP